jgi:hypothetical protein
MGKVVELMGKLMGKVVGLMGKVPWLPIIKSPQLA